MLKNYNQPKSSPMKIKKAINLLKITFFSVLFVSSVMSAPAAEAFDVGSIGDLFTTQDQGLSFEQFDPNKTLELSPEGLNTSLTESTDAREYVIKIVNFALGFLGLIAVLIVIYGGVLYVTAAGEEENATKGKKAITYASIGLLIILGSFAFVNTIIRGASDGSEDGRQNVVGNSFGGSFNAYAVQVRSLAQDIYYSFVFFAEVNEEIKGMLDDLDKASLSYKSTLVSKESILNYLFSVKEKLVGIRSRVTKFSTAYTQINDFVRNVDGYIDQVQLLNQSGKAKVKGDGDIEICSLGTDFFDEGNNETVFEDLGEGIVEGVSTLGYGDQYCSNSYSSYNIALFDFWSEYKKGLQSKLKINDPKNPESLLYILEPIKKDFESRVIESLSGLYEIQNAISGSEAFKSGPISKLFTDIFTLYGYDHALPSNYKEGFLKKISTLNFDEKSKNTFDEAGNLLLQAMKKQIELADEIAKLKSVEAHLRANVVNGSAPLVVTFDVLDSLDPAGGTIVSQSITWNLTGQTTFEGTAVNATISPDVVECVEPTSKEDKEFYGTTFRQCTFKQPGTYIATVKIESNDPSKYVEGMSSLIIKVNPPTTRVNLSINDKITVISYYDSGILKTDKNYVAVTLEEAKKGVKFDASKTENVTNFKWDFGNNKIVETDVSGIQTAVYDAEGRYKVNLEVLNKLGDVDRKIFTLDVSNVAARIQLTPSEDIFVDRPVIIDGTLSSSSSGKIKSYEWKITNINSQGKEEEVDIGSSRNKSSFAYKFKEPGKYTVNLTVVSDLGKAVAVPENIIVESQPPKAVLESNIPDASQPATVHLNAGKSFDPDGESGELEYKWTIEPESKNGEDWEFVNSSSSEKDPIVKFNKKGDYKIKLRVTDATTKGPGISEEFGEATKNISIDNVLDVSFAQDQEVTAILNDKGEATINFKIQSTNAIAYEIDFGDGDKSSGDINSSKSIPHKYTKGGKYSVKVTVYDEDDNDNTVSRRVFIGGGDSPIAKAKVLVNGVEILDTSEVIEVNKKDIITFDASESRNTDGTGRDLKYSWDFGDTDKSSNRTATHSYKELSPESEGYFKVNLIVYDKDDTEETSEDSVKVKVVNKAPIFSSLQAIPDINSADLVTPVSLTVKVYGADDEDGDITQYRWWYYDLSNPDDQLGIQITQSPSAKLIIGTKGKEGKEVKYGFGVEVTDNDNLKVSSEELLNSEQLPVLKVKNGPNAAPTAKFNVDVTKVFTGDKITFTSSSKDPDGKITNYIWDVEGDGFFNNAPTTKSTITHVYSQKNLNGYDVRLKVIDDKGGEAVSEPVRIFVDTLAEPPKAAFKYQVVEGSSGRKVRFISTSTADETAGAKIVSYSWDFDTKSNAESADYDGDGKKDNDTQSKNKDPEYQYESQGEFDVKLTVTDSQGNTDFVSRTIRIPLADAPVAAFTYIMEGDKIVFQNNSKPDTKNGAKITKYIWDFDVSSDLPDADIDGDGKKDNDKNSEQENPIHEYDQAGNYQVKLTVIDNQGNEDIVINQVQYTPSLDDLGFGEIGDTNLKAVFTTNPAPSSDGIVYISGDKGSVTFDFSKSQGSIAYYIFDKNIYFDTDGNGTKNDDQDFKTTLPGTWKTNFELAWGKIVVKLTVVDISGNENTTLQEIKFK